MLDIDAGGTHAVKGALLRVVDKAGVAWLGRTVEVMENTSLSRLPCRYEATHTQMLSLSREVFAI